MSKSKEEMTARKIMKYSITVIQSSQGHILQSASSLNENMQLYIGLHAGTHLVIQGHRAKARAYEYQHSHFCFHCLLFGVSSFYTAYLSTKKIKGPTAATCFSAPFG